MFDDRFAERHQSVSSGTVITQCHSERSSIEDCHPAGSSPSVSSRFAGHRNSVASSQRVVSSASPSSAPRSSHNVCKGNIFPNFRFQCKKCVYLCRALELKKRHILSETLQLFLQFGIKSLTMDDIAKKLCISKKTLYTHVKDKEDLLENAVVLFSSSEKHQIEEICSRGLNAIDESLEIKRWVLEMLQNIHPSVAYDMEKFHPRVHQKMLASRQAIIYKCVFDNIVKGQKDGLYRKEINPNILAKLYVGRMEVMFDQNLFPSKEYNVSDVYMEWFSYHIHGMATAKGVELLNKNILHSTPAPKKKNSKKQ